MRAGWFADASHDPFELNGNGSGALLLHGFMGTPKEMRPLAEALNQAGVGVAAPLLPGFGSRISEIDRVRAQHWLAEAEDAWLKLRSAGNADVLVGFSMGGAIAIHLARMAPPARLVLLAPLWQLMRGDWRLSLLPILKHVVRKIRPFASADFSDESVRQFFHGALPELNLDRADVQERIRSEVEISTATIDELRRLCGSGGRLADDLECDVLVIQGTHDRTVCPDDTRRLAAKIGSRARLEELQADHLLVSDEHSSWPSVRHLVLEFAVAGRES